MTQTLSAAKKDGVSEENAIANEKEDAIFYKA
jgi:hypothetical protein